ncbi:MAG: DUF5711 family protein [Pirellulales bacterium]
MTEREIFLKALQCNAEDAHVLDVVCQGDAVLRIRIAALLAANQNLGTFLETPLSDFSSKLIQSTDRSGTSIGCYRLIRILGCGGMGDVYEAIQESPFRRHVAIKLIRQHSQSADLLARFELERQTLALMDHPNIAKVLDGGTVDDQPYFVMELIEGVPIHEYCRDHHLELNSTLKIFLEVCKAVQHAHQKGIIHRDLKPSNILVSTIDGLAVPKIIDFGVAKIANNNCSQPITQSDLIATRLDQIVGTLEYMSPEQTVRGQQDIDIRADIFSLGTLCYELLTGTTPLQDAIQANSTYEEILEIIREREATRPSQCILNRQRKATDDTSGTKSIAKKIQQELDWIVMKCLEKERSRRYASVESLIADLQRFLQGDLVEARPPSRIYLLKKAVYRYRRIVYPLLAISITTSLGLMISVAQTIRAWRAEADFRNQAEISRIERDRAVLAERSAANAKEVAVAAQLAESNLRNASEQMRRIAQRQAYAARINLACTAWQDGDLARAILLLEELRPRYDQEDLRDFEWYYLWTACNKNLLNRFETGTGQVFGLQVIERDELPDEAVDSSLTQRVLFVCGWNGIDRWCLDQAGDSTARAKIGSGNMWCMVLAPDRNTLISGGSATNPDAIQFWDAKSGTNLREKSGKHDSIRGLARSPDGKWIAHVGFDGLKFFNIETGQQIDTVPRVQGLIRAVAWSSNRQIATGDIFGGITMWNQSEDGFHYAYYIQAAKDQINSLAFNSDGTVLASAAREVSLWNAKEGTLLKTIATSSSPKGQVSFSKDDSQLLVAGEDRLVQVIDAKQGTICESYPHPQAVSKAIFCENDRQVISATSDGSIHIWNRSQPIPAESEFLHFGGIRTAKMLDNDRVLTVANGETRLWQFDKSLEKNICIATWPSKTACVSTDGRFFAIQDQDVINVFDSERIESIGTISVTQKFDQMALSSNGSSALLANSQSNEVKLVNLQNETSLITPSVTSQSTGVLDVQFSADGKHYALGYLHWTTAICDRGTAQPIFVFNQDEDRIIGINSVAFSLDGKLLATGTTEGVIRIWNTIDWSLVTTMTGHSQTILGLSFNPDSSTLASASADKTVRLWDVSSGQERITLNNFDSPVVAATFNLDGSKLLIGTQSGKLRLLHPRQIHSAQNGNLELDPGDQNGAIGLVRRAQSAMRKRDVDSTESLLSSAIERLSHLERLHPTMLVYTEELDYCYRLRARIYLDTGRVDQAESVIRESIKKSEIHLPSAHIQLARDYQVLGECLYRREKYSQSAEWFLKAEKVFSNFEEDNFGVCQSQVWRGLAQIRLGQTDEGVRALDRIQRVVELRNGYLTTFRSSFDQLARSVVEVLKQNEFEPQLQFWQSLIERGPL